MTYLSVFMDIEDPINPLADNAALDIANLFAEVGIKGSFCITGEKCRVLLARKRKDVIQALLPHCLGLHTNTHSVHPTTMELLSDVDYSEGCELAFAAESPGYESFIAAFGQTPTFWGGAGNTWSPEITLALAMLRIPAYAYALTSVPDDQIHRYNGIVALPQTYSISEEDWATGSSKIQSILDNVLKSRQPWIGIFVGHPSKFRHNRFWDTPYMGGRTPKFPEVSQPVSQETYTQSLENLKDFLTKLKTKKTKIIGIDDLLQDGLAFRSPTEDEREFFLDKTTENIRKAIKWPIHRPGLDPELIIEKALRLAPTLEILD
jgi:hypothetical protein